MRFVHDGTKTDFFLLENVNRTISKSLCDEFILKHDLEIQIIDSLFADGALAMLWIFFCFVKPG